jgi:beta-glucosidase
MPFPANFVWGAAAASYQIEGAAYEDGKGLSVWDMFCRKEGVIWRNQNGDIACDHYHRYQEDVAVMKSLGLRAYRLSLSWPRIIPAGVGTTNTKGLAFYDRLIDELLAAGITPYVTLFHWDFPYELYLRGGWLNPDSADWFADYTAVVMDSFSDRVHHWFTLNEPQCFIGLGLREGIHAPGDKLAWREVLLAGHHALLAHGKSVQTIRARARSSPLVGFAPASNVGIPFTESEADIEAARQFTFSLPMKTLWNNTWFADPVFKKEYPADGLAIFGKDAPHVGQHDMDIIGQPLDFFGVNMYHGVYIRAGSNGQPEYVQGPLGEPLTGMGWSFTPKVFYWGPKFLSENYQKPIIITENGMANIDLVALDGKVHDPQRIGYIGSYLQQVERAINDGIDVRGYFYWSILDNFEWAEGYKARFGLVYTDYTTQQRIPKASAYWYKQVIATNGANL